MAFEDLAESQHNQWSAIMRSVFSKFEFDDAGNAIMPAAEVQRRRRLFNTPYANLTDAEKQQDRDAVIKFFGPHLVLSPRCVTDAPMTDGG